LQGKAGGIKVSFTLKKNDEIDRLIADKFSNMIASRAEAYELMRRKPIKVNVGV
jgi:hypothetical protein